VDIPDFAQVVWEADAVDVDEGDGDGVAAAASPGKAMAAIAPMAAMTIPTRAAMPHRRTLYMSGSPAEYPGDIHVYLSNCRYILEIYA
jgi:hypothetical protein